MEPAAVVTFRLRMLPTAAIAAAIVTLAPHQSAGQGVEQLQAGMRIRVTTVDKLCAVGTLTRMTADSIELRPPADNGRSTFGLNEIRSLEVSVSRDRDGAALRYGAYGFFGGALAGAVIGYGASDDASGYFPRRTTVPLTAAVFGTLGFIGGLLAGAVAGSENWMPAPLFIPRSSDPSQSSLLQTRTRQARGVSPADR